MLPLHFRPCRRFGGEVMHKTNRDLMLDPPPIGHSGYVVAQHPVLSILAGFNPQTSTLKPRHTRSSPVLARETAVGSLHCVRGGKRQVLRVGNARRDVCLAPEDKQESRPGGPVPTHDAGASEENRLPQPRRQRVRVQCWSACSSSLIFRSTRLSRRCSVITVNNRMNPGIAAILDNGSFILPPFPIWRFRHILSPRRKHSMGKAANDMVSIMMASFGVLHAGRLRDGRLTARL